jgi:hypothetical protein
LKHLHTGIRKVEVELVTPECDKKKNPDEAGFFFAVRAGFEPAVRFPVRQFSKLVVSASHPPHRGVLNPVFGGANIGFPFFEQKEIFIIS